MAPTESDTAAPDNVTDLAEARRSKAEKQTDPADAAALQPTPAPSEPKTSNRRFNKEKVERIKAAIADGSYKINPSRIADKFIEHERN